MVAASLGEKIKTLRKKKGYSLEKLGKLTNVSKSYIWDLENRSSCNPTADKLAKISYALDVTTDYLTNENAELTSIMSKDVFFRKFSKLSTDDQKKIEQIINLWGNEK